MWGILAPRPGNQPIPSALEGEVLTTGLSRNSLSKVSESVEIVFDRLLGRLDLSRFCAEMIKAQ